MARDTTSQTATPKRQLIVEKAPFAMFKIGFTGGGRLPKELDGMYTNEAIAEAKIKSYLANRR